MPDTSASNKSQSKDKEKNSSASASSAQAGKSSSGEGTKPREAAKDVANDAGSKAAEVRDKVMEETGKVGSELQDQARSTFSESREALADQISRLAKALRGSKEQLEEQNLGALAPYPKRAADRIDEVSNYLRERKASAMRRDLDRAVSERPGLIAGSLAAVGALAVWYIKRDRARHGSDGRERETSGTATSGATAVGRSGRSSRGSE